MTDNTQATSGSLTWEQFRAVDMRVGTILEAEAFPEVHNPAYILLIDFGPLGKLRSSAQITALYTPEELVGRQVVAVVNFPPKQIANMQSQCLVLGMPLPSTSVEQDRTSGQGPSAGEVEQVPLLQPDRRVPNGTRVA
jgi:tRNA-binding protein